MFFVIDETEVSVSWPENGEKGESFKTERAAIKRAEELAVTEPGKSFYVAVVIKDVHCPVGDPMVNDRS